MTSQSELWDALLPVVELSSPWRCRIMWVGLSPAVSQAWRGLPWMLISSPHCGQSTLSRWLLSCCHTTTWMSR